MREIKFRFFNTSAKVMHSWDNIRKGWDLHDENFDIFEETDIWKVIQFTGLLDKNGKEIYDGDIISDGNGDFGIVEFDYKGIMIRWYQEGDMKDKYVKLMRTNRKRIEGSKIIGNKFENLELIKK